MPKSIAQCRSTAIEPWAADRTTVVARSRTHPKQAHARARRAFSQNFLADPVAVQRIVDAAELKPDDLVLEVGAGRGQLTAGLLERCGQVTAYEVDPVMAAAIKPRAGLTVHVEDFLRVVPPERHFSVVGNPPYSLTAPIVDWCLQARTLTSATLLTQLEYAWKRTGHYGRWTRLSISTWPTFAWQFKGRIPRGSFRPVPTVDSGILRVERRATPLIQPAALGAYRRFVDLGFSGVGGSLCASLGRRYGGRRATGACRAARVATDTPVGFVWPEQWLSLFRILER
jgi:23S rRNA (adenine-N6)-dimethyltransferase